MNEGERGPKPRRPLTDAETQMLLDAKRSAEQVLKPLAESLNSKTFQNLVANAQTYENLLAGLKASLPRMDEVIRLAGVSSTDLRSLIWRTNYLRW